VSEDEKLTTQKKPYNPLQKKNLAFIGNCVSLDDSRPGSPHTGYYSCPPD
jgi:hypothetical protein